MGRLLCNVRRKVGRVYQRAARVFLLASLVWGFCYLFCFQYGVFGAKVDWISQHSVLPDYFRQQFYETGELFPEFAANIGGGQNIYNFSYYGLYNPLLLPSYLLPFVKMSDYMMAVQLLSLTASILLMYCWLKDRGFPETICAGVSVLFLLSGPMIFHSYNQIMFVNYMPFLLMGLMGVDRYFEQEMRRYPRQGLTVSIFLMIMTSFYFSIGGMLVLVLYGIHRWLMVCDKQGEKVTLRTFGAEGVKFALHFIAAVMLGGILLVPTAFALTGREGKGTAAGIGELLLPKISMTRFCYSPYGIGMTSLGVVALISLLFARKWHERALALGCAAVLTIPVFAYLLNGGLYVRDKVMIPFLPLLCYILAYYLDGLKQDGTEGRRSTIVRFLPYVLTTGLIYMNRRQGSLEKYWKPLLLDGIVMVVCFVIFMFCQRKSGEGSAGAAKKTAGKRFWRNSVILLLPAIVMLAVFDYTFHAKADRMLDQEFYEEVTDSDIGERISRVTGEEEGFYRTEQLGTDNENAANLNRIWDMGQYTSSIYSSSCHEGYRRFREETFRLEEPFRNFLMQSAVHNPVYQRFMGVKYVASKKDIPGYDAVEYKEGQEEDDNSWKVYENDQVSPVAYGTDQVISEESYRELEFPYDQLALLKYAVVKDAEERQLAVDDIYEGVKQISVKLPETIESDMDEKLLIQLHDLRGKEEEEEETKGEQVLFLRFQIENKKPSKDVAVWAEGIRNKLTAGNHYYYNGNTDFTYAVPLKDSQDTVEMIFGKGSYEIKNVKAYIGRLPVWEEKGEEERHASDETVRITCEEGKSEKRLYQSEFHTDWEKTKGNRIEGTIDIEKPGYFVTTIPYDENFEILVDKESAEAEEVNTAFLGFEIEAGRHEVCIVYHAPGVKAGWIMSIAGLLMVGCMGFYRRRAGRGKVR